MFLEFQVHLIINRYFLPCLLIIGTAGNIIILIVLSRPKNFNHSTARFMLALAVSDLLTLWLVIPNTWIDSMYGFNIREYSEVMCKLHMSLSNFAAQLSILFVVSLNIDRVIALLKPLKCKRYCSLGKANYEIRAIPFILLVLKGHLINGISINENGKCSIDRTTYTKWIWWIWRVISVFFVVFTSIVVVIFANACICSKLVKNKCRRYGKKNKHATEGQAYKGKMSKIFLTLSMVTISFVMCYIPMGMYSLTYGGKQWEDNKSQEGAQIMLYYTVSSSLTLVNNVMNFFIYFLRGSKFRKEARELFCKKK